ncbi:MAG: hypothetical protein ACRDQG_09560 [Pseudonocardiaceae bacterium]
MQMAGGGGSFLAAAQQGMFAVDTDSAGNMIMSIRQMQRQLEKRLKEIGDLKVKAMLGDLPEAHAVADLNVRVAGPDHQSLEFALQEFAKTLEEARQALEIGMRNYAQVEAHAEQGFGQIGH